MIFKIFEAQLNNLIKNDWTEQVKEDLEYLQLNYSHDEISALKKETFAKRVHIQIRKNFL